MHAQETQDAECYTNTVVLSSVYNIILNSPELYPGDGVRVALSLCQLQKFSLLGEPPTGMMFNDAHAKHGGHMKNVVGKHGSMRAVGVKRSTRNRQQQKYKVKDAAEQ